MNKRPLRVGTGTAAEGTFPHLRSSQENAHFFHATVLLMPSRPLRFLDIANAARLLRSDGSTMELLRNFPHSIEPNLSG
jgi:hypothetical protein